MSLHPSWKDKTKEELLEAFEFQGEMAKAYAERHAVLVKMVLDLATALESVRCAMVTDPKDWCLDHRDAWTYGILVGWDEAEEEVVERHQWSEETAQRLRTYSKAVQDAVDYLGGLDIPNGPAIVKE